MIPCNGFKNLAFYSATKKNRSKWINFSQVTSDFINEIILNHGKNIHEEGNRTKNVIIYDK